jgi:hypothetical protein
MDSSSRMLLNNCTHCKVPSSTDSLDFQGCTAVDQLCLVHPVDGFGQRVVVAVATAADRGLDASFSPPFGVPNGHVLGTPIS